MKFLLAAVSLLFYGIVHAQNVNFANTSCYMHLGSKVLSDPFNGVISTDAASKYCDLRGVGTRSPDVVSSGAQGADSFAFYHTLRAGAASNGSHLVLGTSASISSFTDTLVVRGSPSQTGQIGYAIGRWTLTSSVSASAGSMSTAGASVSFTAQIPDGSGVLGGGRSKGVDLDGVPTSQFDPLESMKFKFQFNVPFTLAGQLLAEVKTTESARAFAGASIYWAGLRFVDLGNGMASANWSSLADAPKYEVDSMSGIDWTKSYAPPIPEPATFVIMLVGLAVVWRATQPNRRKSEWHKQIVLESSR